MSSTITTSRGADKYTQVAREIRRRIASGEFSPGSQLPHRTELEEVFQVSKVTLQRVMNMLIEDGFIDATRNKGSFVVDRPPHLSRYALTFQGSPHGDGHWARFWMALVNEAARRERAGQVTIPVFHGIDGHTDTCDYQKLSAEVEEHRLAGVIFIGLIPRQPDLSFLQRSGVPGVTVQSDPLPGIPSVQIDYSSFVYRAVEHLKNQGKQRIAFIGPPDFAVSRAGWMTEAAAKYGMETRPYWIQGVSLDEPSLARNCVRLLLALPQNERPDALVITDDNLTEAVSAGILEAGVKVPTELELVAHANFPWKTPCVVESRRLGFDVRALLGACIKSIDDQRAGEPVQPIINMTAFFENEEPA